MKKLLLFIPTAVLLSSCASMFMPKKQKVTFTTNNKQAKIYLDKEEIGKGTSTTTKVTKGEGHQIVVQTPGYKDQYAAIVQTHRPIAYWCLQPLNFLNFGYGFLLDPLSYKNASFEKVTDIPIEDKIVIRKPADKYIHISNISIDIKNKDKDISTAYVNWQPDMVDAIKKADKKKNDKAAKEDMMAFKKNQKKKKGVKLVEEDDKIKAEDIIFTENVYKTLKTSGFIDTINKIFSDNNNTLVLEGKIKKIRFYEVQGKMGFGNYNKVKLDMVWYVKNTYDEKLDSIEMQQLSGDFINDNAKDNGTKKMFGDAIDIAYLNLHKNTHLTKYLKQSTNFSITDNLLSLNPPVGIITDKSDAAEASVIVKNADGHGSGFAISQDGYIITNYHVIAGKIINKPSKIKVITSSGEELEATVVRTNPFRDLALLKVEKKFNKAFVIKNVKSFKALQDVFTIGAPKSVELGQSVTAGLLSNERKANNNHLLQLSMSVNGGNSGGPLFDKEGSLIGVVTSKLIGANTEGVAFAVPSYLIPEYLNINYK
ncbi:MAG: serine protease [Bacteroidia bacterium]